MKGQTLQGYVISAWFARILISVRAAFTRLSPSAAVVSSMTQVQTSGPTQTGTPCLCVVKLACTINAGTALKNAMHRSF